MRKWRVMVIGLLIAVLFPLMGAPTKADIIVPLPVVSGLPVPLPLPTQVTVPAPIQTTLPRPQPVQTIVVPRLVPTPVPGPTQPPVIVPGPTRTIFIDRPGGTRTQVVIREVPGPTRTVIKVTPTPVPGPTKTVFREGLSPKQKEVVRDRIVKEQFKFGVGGVIAGMLIAFIIAALIYIRGFRKGELYDAKMLRRTL